MDRPNYLGMSDAQIMEIGSPPPVTVEEAKPNAEHADEQAAAAAAAETPETVEGAGKEHDDQSEARETDEEEADAEAEAARAREAEEDAGAHAHGADADVEDEQSDARREKPVEKSAPATELPEGTERIFESFRANGRDMKVKSVDEAIRLMQMGANYSQKRQADKINLGYVKVLEQNGLLDHEKLAYLVDLANKKPEAIAKLVKDANFDVHDIDEDKVAQYKARSLAPSAAQLDLDEVIADIKGTKHFERLVSEMKDWDERSQALLGQHPASLRQLTQQMDNGVYDTIMDEVNRRQVLGDLVGKPIMEAYNEIGREMAEAGKFNKPAPSGPVKKLVTPGKKPSPASKAEEERRRAAAPSKGASTTEVAPQKLDFLNMSDADFAKFIKR